MSTERLSSSLMSDPAADFEWDPQENRAETVSRVSSQEEIEEAQELNPMLEEYRKALLDGSLRASE